MYFQKELGYPSSPVKGKSISLIIETCRDYNQLPKIKRITSSRNGAVMED